MRRQIEIAKKALDSSKHIMVRHMKGSSQYRPKDYNSWKDYWEAKMAVIFGYYCG